MKRSPFTVQTREIVTTLRHLSVERQRIVRDDGYESDFYAIRHPGAVVVIPLTSQGEYIMVRQYRPAIDAWILEFPAGTLQPGEDPQCCARRELIEETGWSAEELIPLGSLYPAPGFCDEVQYGFLAKGLSPAQGNLDEDEVIEVEQLSSAKFLDLLRSENTLDGKSLAFFLRASVLNLVP
jgi:ADP-ribose pyrophosphatase